MCQHIRSIISFCLTIAVIVFIFFIRSDTAKNVFEDVLTQEDKNKFFYAPGTNPLIQPSEIGIKCQMFQNAIMDPKVTKLGDVFSLNIELIHEKTTSLLIIWISSLVVTVFYFICFFKNLGSHSVTILCLSCVFLIASFVFAIANFILLYRLIIAFYYSDMNQFIQFLKCKNVARDGFSKYLFVEDLHYHVALFIIFSIIQIGSNINKDNSSENRRERNNNDIELENLGN